MSREKNNPETAHTLQSILGDADSEGMYPVHYAARDGNLELVQIFVNQNRINLNVQVSKGNDIGMDPIHYAAKFGQIEVVKYLVENMVNINASSKNISSPLMLAAMYGHTAVIDYLVSQGVDVNTQYHGIDDVNAPYQYANKTTALHVAKNIETAQCLINNGANINAVNGDNYTPVLHLLNRSFYNETLDIKFVEWFLDNRANSNGVLRAIMNLSQFCMKECVYLIQKYKLNIDRWDQYGRTPLYRATRSGELDAMKFLVNSGTDVNTSNKNGDTPLLAVFDERFYIRQDEIMYLVDNRADINQPNFLGFTPLCMLASYPIDRNGETKYFLQYFISKGADVNKVNFISQKSPLHYAMQNLDNDLDINTSTLQQRDDAYFKKIDFIKILIKSGADVNAKDIDGLSPLSLFLASLSLFPHNINDCKKLIKYFIANGADVDFITFHSIRGDDLQQSDKMMIQVIDIALHDKNILKLMVAKRKLSLNMDAVYYDTVIERISDNINMILQIIQNTVLDNLSCTNAIKNLHNYSNIPSRIDNISNTKFFADILQMFLDTDQDLLDNLLRKLQKINYAIAFKDIIDYNIGVEPDKAVTFDNVLDAYHTITIMYCKLGKTHIGEVLTYFLQPELCKLRVKSDDEIESTKLNLLKYINKHNAEHKKYINKMTLHQKILDNDQDAIDSIVLKIRPPHTENALTISEALGGNLKYIDPRVVEHVSEAVNRNDMSFYDKKKPKQEDTQDEEAYQQKLLCVATHVDNLLDDSDEKCDEIFEEVILDNVDNDNMVFHNSIAGLIDLHVIP
jgi:ankyrin repeat protein